MEKKIVKIDSLYGAAWSEAVLNVIDVLNANLDLDLSWFKDGNRIEMICEILGINFDEDGNIVK